MISFESIALAEQRIKPFINKTPLVESSLLNNWLGHRIIFKAECLQKTGAFKARGACNTVAKLVEEGVRPKRIIANSSGNHAQAVAWAASLFNIPARIYMPQNVSSVKLQGTRSYGAEIVLGETRAEIDARVELDSKEDGVVWIPPYNHEDVIAGQGTAVLEALRDAGEVDAVFTPCGGGGLCSGSLVATRNELPDTMVIGVEPANADDALRSLNQGSIYRFNESPDTLADGARTLSVSELTFEHLKQLDEFYTVKESRIFYWTQWLAHLLKLQVEPTSAMSMDAVCRWLKEQSGPQTVLVILTGGNLDQATHKLIWKRDKLSVSPNEKYSLNSQ